MWISPFPKFPLSCIQNYSQIHDVLVESQMLSSGEYFILTSLIGLLLEVYYRFRSYFQKDGSTRLVLELLASDEF